MADSQAATGRGWGGGEDNKVDAGRAHWRPGDKIPTGRERFAFRWRNPSGQRVLRREEEGFSSQGAEGHRTGSPRAPPVPMRLGCDAGPKLRCVRRANRGSFGGSEADAGRRTRGESLLVQAESLSRELPAGVSRLPLCQWWAMAVAPFRGGGFAAAPILLFSRSPHW